MTDQVSLVRTVVAHAQSLS